ERPSRLCQRAKVHAKKKKQVFDVCGAPAPSLKPRWQQKSPTLQKPKLPHKNFFHIRGIFGIIYE
ncbi:MAG TPA: hypothetical protein DEO89_00835, partial [Lachnospiraceae bacterium]|nr:hypothetical protein [Lachnospiraceae bacterium]